MFVLLRMGFLAFLELEKALRLFRISTRQKEPYPQTLARRKCQRHLQFALPLELLSLQNYNDFRLLSCRSKASWTEHQNASFGILSGRSDRGCVVRVVRMCSRVVTVATCCVVSLLFCLPSCKDTEFATEFGKEMLEAGADVAGVQPDFLFFTLQDFKWKRQTLNTE